MMPDWLIKLLIRLGWLKPSPPNPPPEPPTDTLAELHRLHNEQRHRYGHQSLTTNAKLNRAAQLHANWMNQVGHLSHIGRDSTSPWDRIRNEGYRYSISSENIAWNYRTPVNAVAGWMSSDGHRANILDRDFTEVGYGKSGVYWCVVFAAPLTEGVFLHGISKPIPAPLKG